MPRRGVHSFLSQAKLQSVRLKTLEHYLPVTLINDRSCPCVQILASFFYNFCHYKVHGINNDKSDRLTKAKLMLIIYRSFSQNFFLFLFRLILHRASHTGIRRYTEFHIARALLIFQT